jgi:hypothetical protein
MSQYETIENDINQLDKIDGWSDKINKMKEIKETILSEQKQLKDLLDIINMNENDYKKSNKNLDVLINKFNEAKTIENKIKYYQLICGSIKTIEEELFTKD